MNVILYMATTPNGFIAKKDDDTSWVSAAEWKSFRAMMARAGNIVIGKRTYDIMRKGNEFAKLPSAKVVVVSRAPIADRTVMRAKSPAAALSALRKRGFRTALVCGGGILNGAFMKAGLVDEIFLDVEPKLFGRGIPLFGNADFEARLRLLGIRKISAGCVQLHYKVMTPR
ncbi:dihydrofolate reductase [Candidatus Woesearchaeota archaeon]|nr:dihydrofolate reductase [Candidatus Woesearchaeota archaeon]